MKMKKKSVLYSLIAAMTATLTTSCSTSSSLDQKYGTLKTVDKIDLNRFMGKWYVIANIPTFIEKNATNAVETYTFNAEKNRIDIDFHFNKNSPTGELKSYPQKGFIENKETFAEWKVQPFWPLLFTYLIIDIDSKDYQYTVIGVPSRSYVWIMARTPQLDETLYQSLLQKLQKVGYDVEKIQKVPQVW